MNSFPQRWLAIRVAVVLMISWSIVTINPSDLDWIACLLISVASGLSVFLWLFWTDKITGLNWDQPTSIYQPFYPMNKYPVRFWVVSGISLCLGGGALILKETFKGANVSPGATFFFLGSGILLAIGILIKTQRTTG